jgi:hypothetical protein
MLIDRPVPFREALNANRVKSILTTTGGTAQLQQLESAIKRRALFSATVSIAEPLVKLRASVQRILAGYGDQATARLELKQLWQDLGYQPDPDRAGGLQDLGSDRRINLQIETNVATARGAGWHEQGMQPDVLDEFPAQELFDAGNSGNRRGSSGHAGDLSWPDRWAKAGGIFTGDRMIALKTDPVWERLGSPELFPDSLGNPYPPFAFNSGWRVRDIDRDEAESLGLITANTQLTPEPLDLDADLAATPALREQWLREAITDSGLGRFDADGVLLFNPEVTT